MDTALESGETAGAVPREPHRRPMARRSTEAPRPTAAVITRPDQHPDVKIAIHALRDTLAQAGAHAPDPSRKTTKYTGAAPLRTIARAQRHSQDALHHRALDFYKALIALSRDEGRVSTQKRAAIMLAALAQRAAGEGYQAVDKDLIQRVLTPMLHSLPVETLCELARLNDRNDGLGDKILHNAGRLLGAHRPAHTPTAAQARREVEVASTLLGVVAELAREHARAASWDRQVAAALEASRNGQHQQLDAALREMWQGDLLTGEMDRPRAQRLTELIGRLAVDQQYALARMLGVAGQPDAATANFNDFQTNHLPRFERDPVMHRQMAGFIEHLRIASGASLHVGTDRGTSARQPGAEAGLETPVYPEPITPRGTFRSAIQHLRDSVVSAFRRKPTTRDAAKAQINQAVRRLVDGDRLTAGHLEALHSANHKLAGKLGQSRGTAFQGALIQEQLSRLSAGELIQLDINLAAARDGLPLSDEEDAHLEAFYEMLQQRLEREAHIRRGAAALGQVLAALGQSRHPEKLLQALDILADAQYQAPPRQSELGFYSDALSRLGEKARATLQKILKGREDVQRHMRGIDDELSYEPTAWRQYRHKQLDILSAAARATA